MLLTEPAKLYSFSSII
ncbi:hypothetical protein CGLO_03437 [Colletotrichum gloeosporioides Cg-14]|uniref:Uncharacterized protein n=1 Tax=Colletotrichum gloeosporioides (strain Cg-14) TaxID=1237896 RepID=T0KVL9_COLGC|nr:hypothetical protein CGLO_03437 [Colletotrichum gloeosporioides Cg-14]